MERLMPSVAPLLMAAGLTMAATLPAAAQDQQFRTQNPYAQPDDSWITIDGTVQSVTRDAFVLGYGDGEIVVEMDDADRDADAYLFQAGDKVTVTGRIDDDVFETTSIEASSVYVQSLGTYFYASSMDEEDAYADDGEWWDPHHGVAVLEPIGEPRTIIRGTVSSVGDDEFTIDRGTRQVTVDVGDLADNPLDDEGYQRVEIGDYVSVRGEVDYDLFEGSELEATSVVTLWDASRTGLSQP